MRVRRYYFVKRLTPGIVLLVQPGCDQQMWTRVKIRRERRCSVTGQHIEKGKIAWSPLTNENNRMDRITDAGIRRLERRK